MAAVRRLFGWMAGLAGIAALARLLSTRQARREAPPAGEPPDPADALRQKLSQTRAEPASETASARPDDPSLETLDERRARIHAKAQETIESMQGLEPPT